MNLRLTVCTFFSAIILTGSAAAGRHADEIIRLQGGIARPHDTFTINLGKLTTGKYYEITCGIASNNISGKAYNVIYITTPTHYPYFKLDGQPIASDGKYNLPTTKRSVLATYTKENLREITITNTNDTDDVSISHCTAIDWQYGPRNLSAK